MIFLATPYTHPDENVMETRRTNVCVISSLLLEKGIFSFSPLIYGLELIKHSHLEDKSFAYWEQYCESLLKKSDELYVINCDGWENSKGLLAEIKFFSQFNKNMYFIDTNLKLSPFFLLEYDNNTYICDENISEEFLFFENWNFFNTPKTYHSTYDKDLLDNHLKLNTQFVKANIIKKI
jgi:hypothetical protein